MTCGNVSVNVETTQQRKEAIYYHIRTIKIILVGVVEKRLTLHLLVEDLVGLQ